MLLGSKISIGRLIQAISLPSNKFLAAADFTILTITPFYISSYYMFLQISTPF